MLRIVSKKNIKVLNYSSKKIIGERLWVITPKIMLHIAVWQTQWNILIVWKKQDSFLNSALLGDECGVAFFVIAVPCLRSMQHVCTTWYGYTAGTQRCVNFSFRWFSGKKTATLDLFFLCLADDHEKCRGARNAKVVREKTYRVMMVSACWLSR